MKNLKFAGILLLTAGLFYFSACDNSINNTPNLEESLELFAGLDAIPEAGNSTVKINKGTDLYKDGYFRVKVGNVLPNKYIKNVETEAWCLEWKKPLRSNNDVHTGVKMFATGDNDKWKPLNYLFSIRQKLQADDPDLTYLEIQAVVWSLAGYMNIAPEFNVDKLNDNELPSRLRSNGAANFSRDKVKTITQKVLSEYDSYTVNIGGLALMNNPDEQDIIIPIPPNRIELAPNPLSIGVSEDRTMTATVFDEDGTEIPDADLNWSIDDSGIATVDQNGVITGVSVGETTVTVESGGISASATVIVTQTVDNVGNEFIIGMLPNFSSTNTIEVHLTSEVSTSVVVDYPINNPTFTTTVNVTPGDITIVEVPNTSSQNWSAGTVQNNAIRASSSQDFVMYAVNREPFTSDAAINLPVSVLGQEYIINSYTPSFASVFSVVAAFDNTVVDITPTNGLVGGFSANTTFSITLNRGEGFLGSSLSTGVNGDLTGTIIESTEPVSVTNGNRCTNVPPGTVACDHMFQVAHPTFSWANETVAAPLPNRTEGSIYRIVAKDNNTSVTNNGSVVATLDRGEFYETPILPDVQVFTANNPIFATQYMTGQGRPGTNGVGDPAMGSLIPTDQYLSAYTFSTVGGAQFAQHWLNIIAHNDDVANGTVFLDGSEIPFADFTAIAGTDYSYAQLVLTEGTHSTVSGSNPHGIYVMGFNSFDSYIYPGGAGISDVE